jgi:hypothetical protein
MVIRLYGLIYIWSRLNMGRYRGIIHMSGGAIKRGAFDDGETIYGPKFDVENYTASTR